MPITNGKPDIAVPVVRPEIAVPVVKPEIAIPVANPAPAVVAAAAAAPVGVAHVPAQVGTAISKTVHYAETPVITGYTSTLYKPDLSAFDTPFRFNFHQRYLRPIKTLVPKLMPVELPTVKEVEVHAHPPILPEVRIANVAPLYYPQAIAPLV